MRAPRGFLSPPQGTTPLPPIPRPDPYPQHRQAAAPGAPHCACPIHGSLLHRWGRGGGDGTAAPGRGVRIWPRVSCWLSVPCPPRAGIRGQWGWGRPHGGPGGLGCVWGGSRLSLLARGVPSTMARAGGRGHPGRGLLHPRLDGHLIFPRFLQRKQTARGWTLTGAVRCPPPPSLGTWGAHPMDSRRVEYPIPYVAPRWVSHPMRGHQMEVPSMCVQPLGITFHLFMVHVISALWPQGCTSYTCSLRCMSCPIYAQALRCMSHPPYSPWYT